MRSAFLVLLSMLAGMPVWAANPPLTLTEAEAVRLGLAQADLADLARGTVAAARAEAVAVSHFPNPSVSYSRERMGGATDTVEQAWTVTQTFDVSGRRPLHQAAAGQRVERAVAENDQRRNAWALEIRQAFFEALLQQEVLRATEAWMQRFARVETRVGTLTRAGEASGYDRRRLDRERQLVTARVATARAALARHLTQLATLTGLARVEAVTGVLLPPEIAKIEVAVARLAQHPEVLMASARAAAAELEDRAARLTRIPEVTVGVGPKWVDGAHGQDRGFALSLSIPLPLFDRQHVRQEKAAELMQARAELRLLQRRGESDLRGVSQQAETLRAVAVAYRQQLTTASPELLRIAEAAYRGGESSLLELLDAYRGALEDEMSALEFEQRAREARMAYDQRVGGAE